MFTSTSSRSGWSAEAQFSWQCLRNRQQAALRHTPLSTGKRDPSGGVFDAVADSSWSRRGDDR